MDEEVKTILEKALSMPQESRALIAERLISSLDLQVEIGVEGAWQQEIQKRIAEIEKGEASFMSWEDARRRLSGD